MALRAAMGGAVIVLSTGADTFMAAFMYGLLGPRIEGAGELAREISVGEPV